MAQELAPRGVTLLGLSMDEPSALTEQVEPFRRKHFPQFHTALRATADLDSIVSVVDPAWNEILPTTYLIGRDGKVIEFTSEEIEKLQTEIARKLGYKLVDHRLELYCVPLDEKTRDDDKT